jgi:hypothetical protein
LVVNDFLQLRVPRKRYARAEFVFKASENPDMPPGLGGVAHREIDFYGIVSDFFLPQ